MGAFRGMRRGTPKGDAGGGSTAGPVFSRIMGYVLGRYGVEPTGGTPSRLPVEW